MFAVGPSMLIPSTSSLQACIVQLPQLRVIHVTGADAVQFMHSQLTQDIAGLVRDRAALGGYCTPNGRLLGSGVLWRTGENGDTVSWLVDASVADSLIKRLRMFVLRSRVSLKVADVHVCGIWLDGTSSKADGLRTHSGAQLPRATWELLETPEATWIVAPRSELQPGPTRWWYISSTVPESSGAEHRFVQVWQAFDISAGLPWVQASTQEALTPLMANFDLIGGVSFSKGCYPGQEVVARSYYRSKPKRRLAWATFPLDGLPAAPETLPGQDVYTTSSDAGPVGRIINAAGVEATGHALFEVPLSLLDSKLRILAEGPPLQVRALPYPLVSDTTS